MYVYLLFLFIRAFRDGADLATLIVKPYLSFYKLFLSNINIHKNIKIGYDSCPLFAVNVTLNLSFFLAKVAPISILV